MPQFAGRARRHIDWPGLRAALAYTRDGDTIVVHTLDRLGRTVRDTLNLIHDLAERGVGVGVSNLADPIRVDSSNPADPRHRLGRQIPQAHHRHSPLQVTAGGQSHGFGVSARVRAWSRDPASWPGVHAG